MFVRLQADPFDPGAETNAFLDGGRDAGAFASFVGTVRSTPEKPVETLTLEHYPALARKQIEHFANTAASRFGLVDIGIIHRFGQLSKGEVIVMVMALAAHRQAAFDGAGFVMDWLKTDAPFWKMETGPDGVAWVDARHEDDDARDKWWRCGGSAAPAILGRARSASRGLVPIPPPPFSAARPPYRHPRAYDRLRRARR